MTTAHTPGPWSVGDIRQDGDALHGMFRVDIRHGPPSNQGNVIAWAFNGHTTGEQAALANALLIAAAPELLAALKRVEKWGHQHGTPEIQGILCDVYQAIARAEGRTA